MKAQTVLSIWNALRNRFQKTVEELPGEDIHKQLGETTVGDLLYHTAEVEYLFSEWFFDQPNEVELIRPTDHQGYTNLLAASHVHVIQAMENLPDDAWDQLKQSAFGESTPLEAVGRLMNHAGMHSGQISYIRTYGEMSKS